MAFSVSLSLFVVGQAAAQGTRSDCERSLGLRDATANKVFRDRVTPHWFADNARFWYRNDLADNAREFIVVDVWAGIRGPAFDHERLARSLGKALGKSLDADRLPIDRLAFDDLGSGFSFACDGRQWRCDWSDYGVREVPKDEQEGSSLRAGRRARPTRQTGPETSITFLNRMDGPVDVF